MTRPPRASLPLLATAALLVAGPARAEPRRELAVDPAIDGAIAGAAGIAWVASELALPRIAPGACRWCARRADGTDALNAVDASARDALRWSDPRAADVASGVLAFGVAPAAALGLGALAAGRDGRLGDAPEDALVVAEAALVAADANQLVKLAVARERPRVHALADAERGARAPEPEDDLSFYSGHTSLAFSLAVASGTVASMRGYRSAPIVWTVGLVAATAAGWLRIAADQHYLTDVLAGAAAGSAVGFAVPWLHRPRGFTVTAIPCPGGGMLGASGAL